MFSFLDSPNGRNDNVSISTPDKSKSNFFIYTQFRSINEISSFLRVDAFSVPDCSVY